MKHVHLGVVVLLALLEPSAAAGFKFGVNDMKSDKSLWRLYDRWSHHFNVARKPVDKQHRLHTFNETVHRAVSRARVAAGEAPRLNSFADLTTEELRAYKCRGKPAARSNHLTAAPGNRRGSLPLPDSIDWRSKTCQGRPCLRPVKSQGRCGACWAFAATGAMESRRAIAKEYNLVNLSEQELVDCDHESYGCKGGEAIDALRYVLNNGIASDLTYAYTGQGDGTCHASTISRVNMTMRGVILLPVHNEFSLLTALVDGPVAVSIAVGDDNDDFFEYTGGLYPGKCEESTPDHAMLLVGYDSESYILRNSYGREWGDLGYMFLPRNRACGILEEEEGGTYPEIGA